jgi:hypothetical protein
MTRSTAGFSIVESAYTTQFPSKADLTITGEKEVTDSDTEAANLTENESLGRPLVFMSAIFVGLGVGMIIVLLLGFGVSQVCHAQWPY